MPPDYLPLKAWWRSVRRECLDHILIRSETHLRRVLCEYVTYFNSARPHQGLQQRIPDSPAAGSPGVGPVCATPVLGGLHHTYSRAAWQRTDRLSSHHSLSPLGFDHITILGHYQFVVAESVRRGDFRPLRAPTPSVASIG
jgi:hypothetical protein